MDKFNLMNPYINTKTNNFTNRNKYLYASNFTIINTHYMIIVSYFNRSNSYKYSEFNTTVGNSIISNQNQNYYDNYHVYLKNTNVRYELLKCFTICVYSK